MISGGSLSSDTRTGVLAGPIATPAAAADCPVAEPSISTGFPPPAIANLAASYRATCNRAGGWSLELPPGWFERWSVQHGREIMSYDPTGMNLNAGSSPDPGQVHIRLQMIQNPEHRTPAEFQAFMNRGGVFVRDQHQLTIARQPAESYTIWQSEIPPLTYLETKLQWYVRSPFFDDRVLVITAQPADSPFRLEVERLVASLRFFQPTAVNLVPTISRSEIVARVTSRPGLALSRIEAKLILRKDLDATGKLGRDFSSDPDALAWVVAYSGTGIHPVIFAPFPRPTYVCLSTYDIYPADNEPGMTATGGCDPKSAWPSWFDSLPNRG
jgi:hypothetical protein